MLGTIVNAAAIIAGSLLGLFLKGGLKENIKTIVTQGVGLAVFFVGASSAISRMMQPEANPILFIISLAAGGVLGELLGIEAGMEKLGNWLQKKIRLKNEWGNISRGFVAASLLYCVGTMAILGPLESGLEGTHTILFAKSMLDGIIAVVMAATLGIGVLFSAGSVFIYQGSLTVLVLWVSPYLTPDMLRELSIVGGILIAAIGLNMLEIIRIKVGNLLPSLFIPIFWYLFAGFFFS